MRTMCTTLGAVALASAIGAQQAAKPAGGVLADMTWQEAEPLLTDSAVIVIPLGAGSLEFGPHMKLNAGERMARYLASRVQAAASVVMAPPLTYHYFPAYAEYAGSTSLSRNTAREETVDVVRSFARYGPRRFYVLNTGGAASGPLADAAKTLADSGILLGWTDMRYHLATANITRQQRPIGGAPHADELETSMMLFIDPSAVAMSKAVAEYGTGAGALTRKQDGPGILSRTGVLGDPTVASAEKGRVLVDTLVAAVLDDIEKLRGAPLPAVKAATPQPPPPPTSPPPPVERRMPNGCTAGEERAIREVGPRFSSLWRQMDAVNISRLFSTEADIRHPDGTIERTRDVIRQNREQLFEKREYRGSVHPVTLYDIRCLGPNTAIADGKWELRYADTSGTGVQGRGSAPATTYSGLCTLVLSGSGSGWAIEAWRYTVNPPEGVPPPTTLKQPGFVGRGLR
jgi:creatinine amidohydrolase